MFLPDSVICRRVSEPGRGAKITPSAAPTAAPKSRPETKPPPDWLYRESKSCMVVCSYRGVTPATRGLGGDEGLGDRRDVNARNAAVTAREIPTTGDSLAPMAWLAALATCAA